MERDVVYFKDIEVDGVTYKVNHPQVEEAFEIGAELVKMIGGSAASLASAAGDETKAGAALSLAVTTLLQKLDPKQTMRLIKRVLINVEAQGEKKILLDESGLKKHFHAKLGSMLRLTGEVLAFTHADFFEAIAEGVAGLMEKVSEKTEDLA